MLTTTLVLNQPRAILSYVTTESPLQRANKQHLVKTTALHGSEQREKGLFLSNINLSNEAQVTHNRLHVGEEGDKILNIKPLQQI